MKKAAAALLLLIGTSLSPRSAGAAAGIILCAALMLSGCGAETAGWARADIATLVPENVTRAELRGHGETVMIEDAGEIAALIGAAAGIELRRDGEADISEPGAASVSVTFYGEGELTLTLPVCSLGGEVYSAAPECIEEFDSYFGAMERQALTEGT